MMEGQGIIGRSETDGSIAPAADASLILGGGPFNPSEAFNDLAGIGNQASAADMVDFLGKGETPGMPDFA